ncbi:MAG TPA: enoyl-CoA hydratase-related protein [Streptosporangiaceae bacterium]|nr:enoyl-CoA hydratase-related protein [Streptosporangiaceae bacterium]
MSAAEFQDIVYEPGRVARVILNRPEKRNAQSWRLLREMDQAFAAASDDQDCRVIVLSGAGPSFSAGHDLDSPEQVTEREAFDRQAGSFARAERYRDVYLDSHLRWRNLTKPTVAVVQGYCVFGGWMIASAMDVIFAADDALFIPVYGDYFTAPWDVGARKAKEILFENRFLTAAEARDCGFVGRTVPAGRLEAEALRYAGRVAENEPQLNRTIKFAINQTLDLMGFSSSVRALSPGFDTQINRERSTAPADGGPPPRDPRFRGRVQRARGYLEEDRGR